MTPSRLEAFVDGETLSDFTTGKVVQSLDAFASSFELEYYQDTADGGGEIVFESGDPVEIRVDGETILAGHVNDDEDEEDPKKLRRKIVGRSKLGDLVDCDAFNEQRRFRDVSILDLASVLCEPYGIAIYDRTEAVEPFERWALNDGTIADELQRAAKARGVVLVDEAGDLGIVRAGDDSTRTVIRSPSEVLSSARRRSERQRFSEYLVKSKRRRRDEDTGAPTSIRATVTDDGVRRLRRKVIHPYGDRQSAVDLRAALERNVRAGRSLRLIYRLPGWLTVEGEVWRPNMRVKVEDERRGIDATLIVVRSTLLHGPSLHRTELELTLPEAYDAIAEYPAIGRGQEVRR